MQVHLYGIWDSLQEEYIRYYPSYNDHTALREFDEFIAQTKSRTPTFDLKDLTLYQVCKLPEAGSRNWIDERTQLNMFPGEYVTSGDLRLTEILKRNKEEGEKQCQE